MGEAVWAEKLNQLVRYKYIKVIMPIVDSSRHGSTVQESRFQRRGRSQS